MLEIYRNKDNTGGPFHKTLKYKNSEEVLVPDIRADMEQQKLDILGFYHLKQIQGDLEEPTVLYDI